MVGDPEDADRSAVLALVTEYFSNPEMDGNGAFAGPVREWIELYPEPTSSVTRVVHERELEHAEIVELTADRAVVEVRARFSWRLIRGTWSREYSSRGPTELCKLDGTWRIVDYDADGQSRRASLVVGELAEQRRDGATVKVLGTDKNKIASGAVIELTNTGTEPVEVKSAFALVEDSTMWESMSIEPAGPVPGGESRRLRLSGRFAVPQTEAVFALALDARTPTRRLPFVITVPATPPEDLVPQPAPPRLPQFRRSWPRALVVYAAITAVGAWWYGWLAIFVPIYVGLHIYWQFRRGGRLPRHLDPVRYGVDAAVVALAFLALWETPAVEFAVPFLVAVAVFFALTPLRRGREAQAIAGVVAGLAWLFVLGTDTKALAPCRIADGAPSGTARAFAEAIVAGNGVRASSYALSDPPLELR
ncbi:MAG TPA: hypothetical protein VG265_15830, partial [Gaiellaceae bacterium]|nr:hypothetical protein [Gaiellaceae bacterium]